MNLHVLIATPERVVFEGEAESVILPGESGVFEVLANHKPVMSRLLGGKIILDGKPLPIRRGVVKATMNKLVAIVEENQL